MEAKISFSTVLIFFCLLIFVSSSNSHSLLQYCDEASSRDPNFTFDFCVSSLQSSFGTKTAVGLSDLFNATLDLSITNATVICSIVDQLLTQKNIGAYKRGALQDCFKLYSNSISTLEEVVDVLNTEDYFKANIDITSIMGAPVTCEQGFVDKAGEVCPVTEENRSFLQLTAMALTFVSMLSEA